MSSVRGHSSLALLYGWEREIGGLVREVSTRAAELDGAGLRVLAVLRDGVGEVAQLQLRIVRDNGSVAAVLVRQNGDRDPGSLVCITDRFGEVYFIASSAAGDQMPGFGQLLEWADFIGRVCEECHPPEWPVP